MAGSALRTRRLEAGQCEQCEAKRNLYRRLCDWCQKRRAELERHNYRRLMDAAGKSPRKLKRGPAGAYGGGKD